MSELERVVSDFSAGVLARRAFVELLTPAFKRDPDAVSAHTRFALMQTILCPLGELSDEVQDDFFDWAKLLGMRGTARVREKLITWSRDWNLDADWCRDYAVCALAEWLVDEWLQLQAKFDGWRLSFKGVAAKMQVRDIWTMRNETYYLSGGVGEQLLSLLNEGFSFKWKGLDFKAHPWYPFARYRDVWARECEADFKAYLKQSEREGRALPMGVIGRFRCSRDKYLREVERAAARAGLVRTPRRWAGKHITWAVRFQVQMWSLSKIAKSHSKDPRIKTVADGINRVIVDVGLTRRENLPAGRPRRMPSG
jgi:hypothetical protein